LTGYAPVFSKSVFDMARNSNVVLLWDFLKTRKKWWLAPIVVFLLLISLLIVFAQGSALAPFIYALF